MRTLVGPNTCVHVGPGVIPTRGYYEGIGASISWQLQAGLRIVGSGIDVTKVKLLATAPSGNRCYALAGRQFAESLSWDLLIPQWLDVLSQATGKTFSMTR